MNPVVDSLLNIMVFVFIGLLIWLYVKKEPGDGAGGTPENLRDDKKG